MKPAEELPELKDHVTLWHGGIILACKRCQKRLRKQEDPPPFAKLKKWAKKYGGKTSTQSPVHVIDVPCLGICPKSAIVLINQAQLASCPAHFSIITNTDEMKRYYHAAQVRPK